MANPSTSFPNVGFALDYVPPLVHNGVKIQCIEVADVQSEIDYWK